MKPKIEIVQEETGTRNSFAFRAEVDGREAGHIHAYRLGRKVAGKVGGTALARLVPAIKDVIAEAIAAGGSTLRDYAQPDGELGYFSKQFDVYDREGQACVRCPGTIARIAQGGRSTWFCPRCQK